MSVTKFKIGDKVKIKEGCFPSGENEEFYTIKCIKSDGKSYFILDNIKGQKIAGLPCDCGRHNWVIYEDNVMELASNYACLTLGKITNIKKIKNNMFETFKGLFVKEPVKSYRNLGITDNNDKPTSEGIDLVVSWFLSDPDLSKKFIETVVTPLNEEFNKMKK